MLNYEGENWAFDLVEYLMRKFSPKGDERLRQLLVKFGQLMLYGEGPQEFTDRVIVCKIDIKAFLFTSTHRRTNHRSTQRRN